VGGGGGGLGQFEEHWGSPKNEVNLASWQCSTHNVELTICQCGVGDLAMCNWQWDVELVILQCAIGNGMWSWWFYNVQLAMGCGVGKSSICNVKLTIWQHGLGNLTFWQSDLGKQEITSWGNSKLKKVIFAK
jgi:hypothetical protein